MVETARALLDELMGRNRNLDPSVKVKKVNWDDPEVSAILQANIQWLLYRKSIFFVAVLSILPCEVLSA